MKVKTIVKRGWKDTRLQIMGLFDFSGNIKRGDFGAKFIELIIITGTMN